TTENACLSDLCEDILSAPGASLHGPVRQGPSGCRDTETPRTAGREKTCEGRRRRACLLVLVEERTQHPRLVGTRPRPQRPQLVDDVVSLRNQGDEHAFSLRALGHRQRTRALLDRGEKLR